MAGPQNTQQLTLLLNHEISKVLTAMRYNARWAVVPSYYEEDRNEPNKYDDAFRTLRAQIYEYTDWSQVDPMTYLAPFLALLKASDVSGPITGTVAVALQRILSSDLILPSTLNAGHAINQLVEDTTQGKFESTNNAQDEVVLLNIVQVLALAVECKASVLLTDETYCKAFQAAFMLGDPVTKPKEYGEIMGYYSRQVCGVMVRTLFTRLRLMAEAATATQKVQPASLAGGSQSPGALGSAAGMASSPVAGAGAAPAPFGGAASRAASVGLAAAGSGSLPDGTFAPPSAGALNHAHGHSHFMSQPASNQPKLMLAPSPGSVDGTGHMATLLSAASMGLADVSVSEAGAVTVLPTGIPAVSLLGAGPGVASTVGGAAGVVGVQVCLHGAKAAVEVLDFLIELVKKRDAESSREQIEDCVVFALEMVHIALLCAGPALMHFDFLVAQVHVELLHAMCEAVITFPALNVITHCCQILSCLYTCLGSCSIGQLELVLTRLLLRLADGKGVSSLEQQEVALEGVLDLVRTPGFVHDIYVNCDCRLERSNLYEELVGLLCRTATPTAKGALSPLHLVSLDALTTVLAALATEPEAKVPGAPVQPTPTQELSYFVDIWTPMVSGQHLELPSMVDTAPAQPPSSGLRRGSSTAQGTLAAATGLLATPSTTAVSGGGVVSIADLLANDQVAADSRNGAASAGGAAGTGKGARSPRKGVAPDGPDSEVASQLRSALFEKHLKQKVGMALDAFNKHHKRGLEHLQALRLLPMMENSAAAQAALEAATTPEAKAMVARSIVGEDELARILGCFLHCCPGLSKGTIGELLGEPDQFYIKVLDAYTASFDFTDLKFDAGIRMFLESFKLPGEAQKIDRIINSFGKHFFSRNKGIFRSADAAYVLAYSVIMLNTDRHNSQVKKKMELDAFRRNLRGVNDGEDFPVDFLNEIFYSIVRSELRMTDVAGMDISDQRLVELHQLSRTPRGHMVLAMSGRQLFDGAMFSLVWRPAVTAMCAVIEQVAPRAESVVESALQGLLTACQLAATHGVDEVADTVIAALVKIPMQLSHITPAAVASATGGMSQRPDVVFGRDARMRAVTRAIATIANRHGDVLTTGWQQVVELLVVLYRQGVLPDTFTRALDGDGEGGLAVREGEATSLLVRRIAAARAASAAQASMFRAFATMLAGGPALPESGDPYAVGPPLTESDKAAAAAGAALLARCAPEDVFLDAKFLKQESLVYLVRAVITAAGPIPRPATVGVGVHGSVAYTAGGAPINQGWDVAELCLELLFGILLRNRDRIAALWPPVYEHLHAIFSHSKEVDIQVVQKAVMAVMRLCLRLLPYKPHITHQLVKGVQLVSLVDDTVAGDMATTIAAELLGLLKGASPYLQTQQVWVALTGLLKIIQYDPPSFPACVEALAWVVREGLTVLNFPLILPALVDLMERAAERSARGQPLQVSATSLSLADNNASSGGAATRTISAASVNSAANTTTLHPPPSSHSTTSDHPPPSSTAPDSTGAQQQQADGNSNAAAGGEGPQGATHSNSSSSGSNGQGGQQGGGQQGGVQEVVHSLGGAMSASQPVGDPVIAVLLNLLRKSEEWLEVWWVSTSGGASSAARTSSAVSNAAALAATGSASFNSQHDGPASAAAAAAAGVSMTSAGGAPVDAQVLATFQQEAWAHVISSLCRAIKNPNLQVRLGALEVLQRSVVAAEKLCVAPTTVQRVLLQLLLPITHDMTRLGAAGSGGSVARDFPQADVTVRELVRALAKVVLLYAPHMANSSSTPTAGPGQALPSTASGGGHTPAAGASPSLASTNSSAGAAGGAQGGPASAEPMVVGSLWGPAWRGILEVLVMGMQQAAPKSEVLADAIPSALKNMVLMLHAKGALREGWRDAQDGTDLADATWRAARKVSANLTPAILNLN